MSHELTRDGLKKRIKVASGEIAADLVLKDARIPNVFTNEIINVDVAIADGYIAGIGRYRGRETVDCAGLYVCPAFVDGHVHLESTMALPGEFAKAVIPHGTLTAIVDPHEIANVCGLKGIRYYIDETEALPMSLYFMAPSCVPATPREHNGAVLPAAQLSRLLASPKVLGLGEVMDYLSVIAGSDDMLQKLIQFQKRKIDGHLAGVFGAKACAYAAAGILTNHECASAEEVLEYLRLGMYIQVREGSAAKNLDMILTAAKTAGVCLDRLFFCTDDKNLADIKREGHILHNVRKALRHGFSLYDVLRMASLNAARCYGLAGVGGVAPGFRADLLVVSDIERFIIEKVLFNGTVVSENGSVPDIPATRYDAAVADTVKMKPVAPADFEIKLNGNQANVITIIPGQLVTRLEKAAVPVKNGVFVPDKEFAKAAVLERHNATGRIGLGIVRGFGIKNCAIASTIAHDSHNLIIIGDNDRDILAAVSAVQRSGGGIYIVSGGRVLGGLPLPVAGLMSDKPADEIIASIAELSAIARSHGVGEHIDPLGMLSFLALPVIPEARITPDGLFDVQKDKFISVN